MEKAAEQVVESACHLADLAAPNGWSTTAVEDVLDAIETLTETLGGAGAELAQARAAVATATVEARRRLGIAVDDQAPGPDNGGLVPGPRGPGRKPPRRRGLGPGIPGHP
ncbi:hypothetical protein [Streptomyces violaceus]|uniref:Uncharacterized protein n=1 Tax=Streptomyces violaceus TaxID=1936 RepID=A0ABY9UKX9_STRVL|nr:hypothetical protein [Streptomyces janthinus]WND23515.1 hypothetical protein RI060_42075 [Streptomyces janthinus]GGS98280.1 hypothetical protein GCM10010270_82810 [Streptomyces janthinus]